MTFSILIYGLIFGFASAGVSVIPPWLGTLMLNEFPPGRDKLTEFQIWCGWAMVIAFTLAMSAFSICWQWSDAESRARRDAELEEMRQMPGRTDWHR